MLIDKSVYLIGLDIETTSLSEDRGLLSIGAYIEMPDGTPEHFYTETIPHRGSDWDYKSSEINGFYPFPIRGKHSKHAYVEADYLFTDFIEDIRNQLDDQNYPRFRACGFNVGQFDIQTIRKHLPNFARSLGTHRVVELNSLILAYSAMTGRTKYEIKDDINEYLSEDEHAILIGRGYHDALYDAVTSYAIARDILSHKV